MLHTEKREGLARGRAELKLTLVTTDLPRFQFSRRVKERLKKATKWQHVSLKTGSQYSRLLRVA